MKRLLSVGAVLRFSVLVPVALATLGVTLAQSPNPRIILLLSDQATVLPFGGHATAANRQGLVALRKQLADYGNQALVWEHEDVDLLPDLNPGVARLQTHAADINDAGTIVGMSLLASDLTSAATERAVRWTKVNGTWAIEELEVLPDSGGSTRNSRALAINDAGVVAGGEWSSVLPFPGFPFDYPNAVLWTEAGIVALPRGETSDAAEATGINNNGLVIGNVRYRGTSRKPRVRAAVWRDGNVDLLPFPPGGTENSWALHVNDRGDIVGSCQAGANPWSLVLLWRDGSVAVVGEGNPIGLLEGGEVLFNARGLGPLVWRDGVVTPILLDQTQGHIDVVSGKLGGRDVVYGRWFGLLPPPSGATAAIVLPLMANAGLDQRVEATGPASAAGLDGSWTTNPHGSDMDFLWSGPFGTATGTTTTVLLPIGIHDITLKVDDGHGGLSSDIVIVEVTDTTPPTLTLPGDLTVDPTSVRGAPVAYAATATDLVDGLVPAACAPASGMPFPIGTTTVACSAADTHGNTATGTFTVTVRTLAQMLARLLEVPAVQALPSGGDLVRKALEKLLGGQTHVACNHLNAFANQVRAHAGKRISVGEADSLLADITRTAAALGCR